MTSWRSILRKFYQRHKPYPLFDGCSAVFWIWATYKAPLEAEFFVFKYWNKIEKEVLPRLANGLNMSQKIEFVPKMQPWWFFTLKTQTHTLLARFLRQELSFLKNVSEIVFVNLDFWNFVQRSVSVLVKNFLGNAKINISNYICVLITRKIILGDLVLDGFIAKACVFYLWWWRRHKKVILRKMKKLTNLFL